MEINWEELRYKEVIRISDGCRLGYPGDLEVDTDRGVVITIIIPGKRRFFGLFGREADQRIPWDHIRRFGDDIILVDEPSAPSIPTAST